MTQHACPYVGVRLSRAASSLPSSTSTPPWPPIAATDQVLSHFTISGAYCSPRGHGGVPERDGDGVVPTQVLLSHLHVTATGKYSARTKGTRGTHRDVFILRREEPQTI